MKLQMVFDALTYGELANSKLSGSEHSGIQESDYHKVITLINMGLTDLHTRFDIRTKNVTIQQYNQITGYILSSEYAQSNTGSTQPIKYIIDSPADPFIDDVLSITAVFDELGAEYAMNDEAEFYSVHTPIFNQVQVPYANAEVAMAVAYRADHARLTWAGDGILDQEVSIPPTMLSPLCMYVASKLLSSKQTLNGDSNVSQDMLIRYERACQLINQHGVINSDNTEADVITSGGWA